MENKSQVSRVKIIIDDCAGSHQEISYVVPNQIATDIAIHLMDWKEGYVATPAYMEKYFEAEKQFIEKEKAHQSSLQQPASNQ